eukprot:scaffold314861_cov26-Tisochrysis_lutea.AAC.1
MRACCLTSMKSMRSEVQMEIPPSSVQYAAKQSNTQWAQKAVCVHTGPSRTKNHLALSIHVVQETLLASGTVSGASAWHCCMLNCGQMGSTKGGPLTCTGPAFSPQVRRFVRYNLGEGLEKKSSNLAEEVAQQTKAKEEEVKASEVGGFLLRVGAHWQIV